MTKGKMIVVVVVVLTVVVGSLLGIVLAMKDSSGRKIEQLNRDLVVANTHIELIMSEAKDNIHTWDTVKAQIIKDDHEAFRTRLVEIVRAMQPKIDKVIAAKIVKHIVEESEVHNLDPVLITALMWTESRFDPFARSKKNAVGLMQIRYSIWKKTPVMLKNGARKEGGLFWIDINIKVGTGIFKEYYDKSGHDIAKTLWRYNSGQTKFPKGKRSYDVTYVNKVLTKAYKIKEMLKKQPNEKAEEEHKE